jgi:hypothetical protein
MNMENCLRVGRFAARAQVGWFGKTCPKLDQNHTEDRSLKIPDTAPQPLTIGARNPALDAHINSEQGTPVACPIWVKQSFASTRKSINN